MEIKYFLIKLLSNPITVFASALIIGAYIIISSYISGKWFITKQKLNSNTKKAKNLLKFGFGGLILSFVLFSVVIPFMSFSDISKQELKNPYLGDWIIISSPIEVIPNSSRVKFYIDKRNAIKGTITSTNGKELGFFSSIKANHYNYCSIEKGKFNSNFDTKLDFKSKMNFENKTIEIQFFTKNGREIGKMIIKE